MAGWVTETALYVVPLDGSPNRKRLDEFLGTDRHAAPGLRPSLPSGLGSLTAFGFFMSTLEDPTSFWVWDLETDEVNASSSYRHRAKRISSRRPAARTEQSYRYGTWLVCGRVHPLYGG